MKRSNRPDNGPHWRRRLYYVLFEGHRHKLGRLFDEILMVAILVSVTVVMLDSVVWVQQRYEFWLHALEWFFTVLFTLEYGARLAAVRVKRRYALSFFGIVDLLSIVPTYLSLLLPGAQMLAAIRLLRVLRVFRVLKLVRYLGEADMLGRALVASRYRIAVFLIAVLTTVVILGSFMYLIEGPAAGFTSIPVSVYWAVVTLTTVGFGDITPATAFGQFMAAMIMLLGYSLIAVPTGLVSAEMVHAASHRPGFDGRPRGPNAGYCPICRSGQHDADARFCKKCGARVTDRRHATGRRPGGGPPRRRGDGAGFVDDGGADDGGRPRPPRREAVPARTGDGQGRRLAEPGG